MENIEMKEKWPLFRLIIPAFSEINIFTSIARKTTALGPIMVATAADKLWGWRVEVIDENNYRKGPRGEDGYPDHIALQKERPADVVGFFCSLSSTMERVWKLAKFYKAQNATNIAGGWHTHYAPLESLTKGIDIIVHGDGELAIQEILQALKLARPLSEISGICYLQNGKYVKTSEDRSEIDNLSSLPYPNFGLLKYGKIKIYPIGRIRGCSKNCEFCSVKGRPRWARAEHLFDQVSWLVETRGANDFFIVDDRLEEDREGTIRFFEMIYEKYGCSLEFTVQIRLEAAEDTQLLTIMKKAGVRTVCIGFESCFDEELKAMGKGYRSKDMIKWARTYHDLGFIVHGMFIWLYPLKETQDLVIDLKARVKQMKKFIRKCRLNTIQILRTVPLLGCKLRERLNKERRIIPLEQVPWSYYDGSYVCYLPENVSIRELQEVPAKIMRWFYNPLNFVWIPIRILSWPISYLTRSLNSWRRNWRHNIYGSGGYILIRRWQEKFNQLRFIEKLENFQKQK